MKTTLQLNILKLLLFTTLSMMYTYANAQLDAIFGDTEVCVSTSATYTPDFDYEPEGETIFFYLWEVENGIITKLNYKDGTSSNHATNKLEYAAMMEPNPTLIPESITVEWNEEVEGSVKIQIEKKGVSFGNAITIDVIFDSTLPVTISSVSDSVITSVSDYVVCDENDIVTLVGDKGTADNSLWQLDGNMTCSDCFGDVVKVSPNPGFTGYMTATYHVACEFTWYEVGSIQVWVGPPSTPVITLPYGLDCLEAGSNTTLFVSSEGADSYRWDLPDCGTPQTIDNFDADCYYSYNGAFADQQNSIYVGAENGQVSVWATNECGTSSSHITIKICEDDIDPYPSGGSTFPTTTKTPRIPFTGANSEVQNRSVSNENLEVITYPNPASEFINVSISNYGNANFKYEVRSFAGELISKGKISESKNTIDISSVPKGVYLINIFDSDIMLLVEKIIKI